MGPNIDKCIGESLQLREQQVQDVLKQANEKLAAEQQKNENLQAQLNELRAEIEKLKNGSVSSAGNKQRQTTT
jgi:cell division protein FtsB